MDYKGWEILIREEWNGIAVDCIAPDGRVHPSFFCFSSEEAAVDHARDCIDSKIRAVPEAIAS
ncbi:hypothetical protein [Gloeobacter morelensis]|uniref:Uncharacterized protein n=1 Tax=Gloeobacter morelensis MG652769 TaxID=2781736 RepID=A0ABY3PS55_9CYAN|nr:hypothetical protein [Gloeobacter morelensis]UFP96525.1 hypothetical protein ISF26_10060 [Gloeobacter morelensis MG652769]